MNEIDETEILNKFLDAEGIQREIGEPTTESPDESDASIEAKDTSKGETQSTEAENSKQSAQPKGSTNNPDTSKGKPDSEPEIDKPVAYKQFKKVWARTKEQDRKIAELQAELDRAKASPASKPSEDKQAGRDELDDIIDEVAFGKKPQYSESDSVQELRKQIQADRLEREQEKVVQEYPDVPIHFAYQLVAQNPRLSLKEAAEQISLQLTAVEEAVLAKHRAKESQKTVQAPKVKPSAPPEMETKSGSMSDKGKSAKIESNYEDLESRVLRQLGLQ